MHKVRESVGGAARAVPAVTARRGDGAGNGRNGVRNNCADDNRVIWAAGDPATVVAIGRS
jgi:hypothetical protein